MSTADGRRSVRRGRLAPALALALAGLGGPGCGADTAPAPAPSGGRPAAPAAKEPQPRASGPSARERGKPTPSGEDSGALSVGDPAKLPGDPVPVRYLPPGFVLPAEATVRQGFGRNKPESGLFFLEIRARLAAVKSFFEQQYPANGWEQIKETTFEEGANKGFDFLFLKRKKQQSAGFRAQENRGKVMVVVQYSDNSKLLRR